jgi:hypothetical protein
MLIILNLHVKIKVSNAYATSCIKKIPQKTKNGLIKTWTNLDWIWLIMVKFIQNFLETIMSKTIITNFKENITNCENLRIDNINKL